MSSESVVRVPKRLAQVLRERFAAVIEEDDATSGFWTDVAKAFDVEDEGLLTDEQEAQAKEFCRRVAASVRFRK